MTTTPRNLLLAGVVVVMACTILMVPTTHAWVSKPSTISSWTSPTVRLATVALQMSDSPAEPTTFREAEVLGLRLMQDGNYQGALDAFQKGLKLPGSKKDVVRTKLVSGPSPVGGSAGGTESNAVQSLDEFELQAAHYNMACAYAKLDQPQQAVANLQKAFDNGFDNYATVRSDPDLKVLVGNNDFDALMERVDSQTNKGFNPFGFLKK